MGRENKCDKGHKLQELLANWLAVDIKKQNAYFFTIVRHLNATRLDPKSKLENEHVTLKECNALFRGNTYKLKAIGLALCDRIGMEDIYWRVFGTSIVTNN
jgi:hypothetical protein